MGTYKQNIEKNIYDAGELLKRNASYIAFNLDKERVSDIYITVRINGYDVPTVEIDKTYIVDNGRELES